MNDFDENLICLKNRIHIENDEEKDKETNEETCSYTFYTK
jgi:hypothetical protein